MKINSMRDSKKYFTEVRTNFHAKMNKISKGGVISNLALRLSAPVIATAAAMITIAEAVSSIAETAFKGFIHIFCLSDDSNILLGVLFIIGAGVATPINLIAVPIGVVVEGGVDTIGFFVAPEKYSKYSENIYKEKRTDLDKPEVIIEKIAALKSEIKELYLKYT